TRRRCWARRLGSYFYVEPVVRGLRRMERLQSPARLPQPCKLSPQIVTAAAEQVNCSETLRHNLLGIVSVGRRGLGEQVSAVVEQTLRQRPVLGQGGLNQRGGQAVELGGSAHR